MDTWDVIYKADAVDVEPHFCRQIDCFGTNPEHGFTWQEACQHVAAFHEARMKEWLEYAADKSKHPYYGNEDDA